MLTRGRKRRGRKLRPRREEAIAAAAALALLVLLFFPWYDVAYSGGRLVPDSGIDRTAWETLEAVAPLLALFALSVLGLVVARVLAPAWRPAIVPGAAIAVLGGIAFVLTLVRVLFPPDVDGLVGVELAVSPGLPAFLALAAALGIAVGGYRAMRSEGSSFAAVAEALRPPRERPASRTRSRSSSG